ncbi:DNA polymerase III subunit delta [Novosphingobium piscinae]|uniref:DNA-directed DNA polymerase n=1 Tax=Novosphingobium piscinae TaxID=1507448 RepID=A0A7X1G0C3_9SPHN|nr:DNA polymerase III subunit delta [Novosphingobium piscinae]MBC2670338.1 DNA polymerase III subunit delta [Novosphingobium piscinae]
MKATQKDFAAVAPRAAREARVFFLCGQDEAGIQDGAARIVGLLDDPGERIELAGADLRRDPVRLGDEARSTSLFGGARHIVVRVSGDEAAEAVANLLDGHGEACPVILLAANATDKSKTAKLLGDRSDALVVTFWPPDLKSVAGAVRTMADAAGVRIDGAMAERIARAAGLDTRIARSEIAKLALYLDAGPESPKSADAAAFEAIGASTEEDGFMPLVNAVLGGEAGRIPGELRRMRELGLNPVAVVLALERRAAQLAALAAKLGPRGDVRQVIEAEKAARRIFWKDERDLTQQLKRWRGRRLERLVARTAMLHRQLLANSQSAELFLAQGLAEIGRVAAAKG